MTLLEVLVALAIFATAAMSVLHSVAQHTNTLGYLEEKTFAAMVADNQMAKVMLSGAPKKTLQGKEEMANREWYWKVQPVSTVIDYLSAFDVSVSLDKEGKNPIITVRSYAEK